jgi:hypothetical protein
LTKRIVGHATADWVRGSAGRRRATNVSPGCRSGRCGATRGGAGRVGAPTVWSLTGGCRSPVPQVKERTGARPHDVSTGPPPRPPALGARTAPYLPSPQLPPPNSPRPQRAPPPPPQPPHLAGQQDIRGRDLAGLRHAAHLGLALELRDHGAAEGGRHQRRVHGAGRDGVDADACGGGWGGVRWVGFGQRKGWVQGVLALAAHCRAAWCREASKALLGFGDTKVHTKPRAAPSMVHRPTLLIVWYPPHPAHPAASSLPHRRSPHSAPGPSPRPHPS